MKFEHYSGKEFSLEERHYPQSSDMKPTGFWFSPENEDNVWHDFCSSEDFRLERLKYRYTFNLDTSKILLVDSHDGIDEFYEHYKGFGDVERALAQTNYARERRWSIDWAKVAERYSGILISPYQHSQRLGKNMWYYGWDCASGCVWDTSVVSNWKLENREG